MVNIELYILHAMKEHTTPFRQEFHRPEPYQPLLF